MLGAALGVGATVMALGLGFFTIWWGNIQSGRAHDALVNERTIQHRLGVLRDLAVAPTARVDRYVHQEKTAALLVALASDHHDLPAIRAWAQTGDRPAGRTLLAATTAKYLERVEAGHPQVDELDPNNLFQAQARALAWSSGPEHLSLWQREVDQAIRDTLADRRP